MGKFLFAIAVAVLAGCDLNRAQADMPDEMQPAQIKAVMARVADWQIANPSKRETTDWTHGAFYSGLMAWAQMADSDKYEKALLEFGEKNEWQPSFERIYHADFYCVGQMYIDMYRLHKDPRDQNTFSPFASRWLK